MGSLLLLRYHKTPALRMKRVRYFTLHTCYSRIMALGYHHHWHRKHTHKSRNGRGLQSINVQKLLDKFIYLASVTAVLANLPQLLKIWVEHNSSGVSLTSWATFLVGSFFWIFYGYVHKSLSLIVLNCSLALVQFFIVLGILIQP